MSVNVPLGGKAKTIIKDLTVNTAVTLYAPDNVSGTFESLTVCNDSGSTAHFTLTLNNGSITVKLFHQYDVASKATYQFKEHPFTVAPGWTLAIQAGTADALHVVAVIIETASLQ